jgi:hypothetical protein
MLSDKITELSPSPLTSLIPGLQITARDPQQAGGFQTILLQFRQYFLSLRTDIQSALPPTERSLPNGGSLRWNRTLETIIRLLSTRFVMFPGLLATCAIMILFLPFILVDYNNDGAQQSQPQAQQTTLGAPVVLIPAITQNILTIVSFLIGTASFILGLKIQSAARATSSTTSILPSSIINRYFDLLILALVVPSIAINIFGILVVGSHLYPAPDIAYLVLLFALFIPAGAILFLVRKLRIVSSTDRQGSKS